MHLAIITDTITSQVNDVSYRSIDRHGLCGWRWLLFLLSTVWHLAGGGGMVLSRTALQLIAGSNSCGCPRPDTPDDMWLGACAESLRISIVHFHGFHQVGSSSLSLSFSFFLPFPSVVPSFLFLSLYIESMPISYLNHFFFQARPNDYPLELLQTQFVVSFHKHWMLDPLQVYDEWFADSEVDPDVTVSRPSRPLDDGDDNGDDCHLLHRQKCGSGVNQAESKLFQTASRERIPDELWHILFYLSLSFSFSLAIRSGAIGFVHFISFLPANVDLFRNASAVRMNERERAGRKEQRTKENTTTMYKRPNYLEGLLSLKQKRERVEWQWDSDGGSCYSNAFLRHVRNGGGTERRCSVVNFAWLQNLPCPIACGQVCTYQCFPTDELVLLVELAFVTRTSFDAAHPQNVLFEMWCYTMSTFLLFPICSKWRTVKKKPNFFLWNTFRGIGWCRCRDSDFGFDLLVSWLRFWSRCDDSHETTDRESRMMWGKSFSSWTIGARKDHLDTGVTLRSRQSRWPHRRIARTSTNFRKREREREKRASGRRETGQTICHDGHERPRCQRSTLLHQPVMNHVSRECVANSTWSLVAWSLHWPVTCDRLAQSNENTGRSTAGSLLVLIGRLPSITCRRREWTTVRAETYHPIVSNPHPSDHWLSCR